MRRIEKGGGGFPRSVGFKRQQRLFHHGLFEFSYQFLDRFYPKMLLNHIIQLNLD